MKNPLLLDAGCADWENNPVEMPLQSTQRTPAQQEYANKRDALYKKWEKKGWLAQLTPWGHHNKDHKVQMVLSTQFCMTSFATM
jgi:hypothetical protein